MACGVGVSAGNDQRVRHRGVGERLAQAAGGQHAVVEIARVGQQQVDVARQPHVLEAIVEQVHRGVEARLGQLSGGMAIGTDEDRHAG